MKLSWNTNFISRAIKYHLFFSSSESSTLSESISESDAKLSSLPMIELEKQIDQGGQSGIYIGSYQKKQYAIKSFHNGKEANILNYLQSLKAPNIIHYFGAAVSHEGERYFMMEYLPNGNLYDFVKSNVDFSWLQRRVIMEDIAVAVEFLHGHNILHRDIKPENVLLTNEMHAKLCDFGLSSKITDKIANKKLVGTLDYLAPETMEGKSASTKSDIYSMGLTFWTIASRKDMFRDGEDPRNLYERKISGRPDKIPAECPPRIATLIQWCWKAKPSYRPNAKQVVEELIESRDNVR